jgi:hypothetical protein
MTLRRASKRFWMQAFQLSLTVFSLELGEIAY